MTCRFLFKKEVNAMYIDFHTHLFPDKIAPSAKQQLIDNGLRCGNVLSTYTDMTLSSLMSRMDEWGVDMSLVLPIATKPSQTRHINEFAATLYEKSGGRVMSFGSVHPDCENWKEEIDIIEKLGLKGMKFHAEYQSFTLDEPRMIRIYDYAFSKGLIIIHHAGVDLGMPAPYHTSPAQFAYVAKELQGGTLIAAHLGGHAQWDDVERYIIGSDIYIDTSMGQKYYSKEQFMRFVKHHGSDKILFATDSPWSRADEEIASINSLDLTDEQKDNIFYKNAKRLLRL